MKIKPETRRVHARVVQETFEALASKNIFGDAAVSKVAMACNVSNATVRGWLGGKTPVGENFVWLIEFRNEQHDGTPIHYEVDDLKDGHTRVSNIRWKRAPRKPSQIVQVNPAEKNPFVEGVQFAIEHPEAARAFLDRIE